MRRLLAAIPCAVVASVVAAGPADNVLKHHDGTAEGKKSLGGSGEIIEFTLEGGGEITGLRIHGSRYGVPQPPKEEFLIYFLNGNMTELLNARMAPYSLFERGSEQWVDVKFREPVKVPEKFRVVVDFRAERTKGVYVSFDASTKGKHSFVGLPGLPAEPTDAGGDWMIEAITKK
jgi:hypothetical protein